MEHSNILTTLNTDSADLCLQCSADILTHCAQMIATKHEKGCQTSLNVCKAFDLQNTLISLLYSFCSSFYLSGNSGDRSQQRLALTPISKVSLHLHLTADVLTLNWNLFSLVPLKALFDQENHRMKQHHDNHFYLLTSLEA